MKKALKIMAAIGGALVLLLAVCAVNHQIQLGKEAPLFAPIGGLVDVDGGQMSVYVDGTGRDTLVFLSGSGTCSPILDVPFEKMIVGMRFRQFQQLLIEFTECL